jgi:hypothetical protein
MVATGLRHGARDERPRREAFRSTVDRSPAVARTSFGASSYSRLCPAPLRAANNIEIRPRAGSTDALTTLPSIARLGRMLPLAAACVLIAYGMVSSAGVLGVALLAVIVVLAAGLVLWTRRVDASAQALIGRIATAALLCAPALLIVFFSFSAGGFFPDTVALGTLAVAVVFVVRLGLAERPLSAIGPAALVPLAGLGGLAAWALLSQVWSHAPGRADVSFDRDLLYLLTFALYASLGRTRARLAWALRAVAVAITTVAAFSLLSRVAPDVLATAPVAASDGRLAYPLSYWNALGVFCAVGGILCVHLTANDERYVIRVLAAGALPVIGTTLLLTYSRGGLGVAAVGIAAYAVLGRPRGLLPALLASGPLTAVAMKLAYDDTLLSSADPTTPAAVHQGHHLALAVLACAAGALLLRALLLRLDRLLEGERSPIERHHDALRNGVLISVAIAVVVAIALGAPSAIAHRWNQFQNQQTVTSGSLVRSRLSSVSNNGRVELWTIAWDAFKADPLDGTGAETYEVLYNEHRNAAIVVVNAHSLYIETLAELGLVGLAFVLLYVLGTLVGLAPFGRGRDRPLYAALFAAGLAWALHAGVDWDWQMPAVSLPFAALGGLALSRPDWRPSRATGASSVWSFLVGSAIVAVAVLPALVLASQVRLNEAIDAYSVGNCTRAHTLAQSSIDALGTRAGPWQIMALCSIDARQFHRAQREFRGGLAQDPNDWQLQAGLAAATAAAGSDARGEVALARRLNPLDPGVRALAQALAGGPSARARRAALAYFNQQSLIESG